MHHLIVACFEQPLEEANWLVLADWLEENGHPIGPFLRHVIGGCTGGWRAWFERGEELARCYRESRDDLARDAPAPETGPYRCRLLCLETRDAVDHWGMGVLPPETWTGEQAESALYLALLCLLTRTPSQDPAGERTEPFASRQLRLALEDYEGIVADLVESLEAGATEAEESDGFVALETPSRVLRKLLIEWDRLGVPDNEGLRRKIVAVYELQNRARLYGGFSGGAFKLWLELSRRAGRDSSQVMARIDPAEITTAVLFNLAATDRRNRFLGYRHVHHDMAQFDRLVRDAFTDEGGAVCQVGGDEWVAFTKSAVPDTWMAAVLGPYVDASEFSYTWRFEARLPEADRTTFEWAARGIIERAVRCGFVTLTGRESVEAQVKRMRSEVKRLPLNRPVRLDSFISLVGERRPFLIQLVRASDFRCPFCGTTILAAEETIERSSRGLRFDPPVGPLRPGDPPTRCGGCPALLEAEDPF